MNLAELLERRNTGTFRLGDVKPASRRLAEILPKYGLDAAAVGDVVAEFYATEEEAGIAFTLRRITKSDQDRLKPIVKIKSERTFDPKAREWIDEKRDDEDAIYCNLAFAIVEPAFPEDMALTEENFAKAIRARADYLAKALTVTEATELMLAVSELNSFNLRRAQEQVKN